MHPHAESVSHTHSLIYTTIHFGRNDPKLTFLLVQALGNQRLLCFLEQKVCTFKEGKKERKKVTSLSHVRAFATPWTVVCQAPLSMGFSRQEYCSGLPFPSPGDLPDPGIEPTSPAMQTDSLPAEPPGKSLS